MQKEEKLHDRRCVKIVRIWNFSGLYPVRMRENMGQENAEYGHSSSSEMFDKIPNTPVEAGKPFKERQQIVTFYYQFLREFLSFFQSSEFWGHVLTL